MGEEISDSTDGIHCPGPDEAFVTTCSGGGSSGDGEEGMKNYGDANDDVQDADLRIPPPSYECESEATGVSSNDDDIHLVNEVISEGIVNNVNLSSQQEKQQLHHHHHHHQQSAASGDGNDDRTNDGQQQQQQQQEPQNQSWSDGTQTHHRPKQQPKFSSCTTADTASNDNDEDFEYSAYHQLKKTTTTFVHRYYTPLPKRGKCAIGSACGFLASRLSLGVANRIFRVAGATWVLSEAIHASGLCDEKSCAVLPEEARPWIVIVRRSMGKKVEDVRRLARKMWNKERIRDMARQDEAMACGFAAGAFVGFIV